MGTVGKIIVTIVVIIIAFTLVAIIPWKVPTGVFSAGVSYFIVKNIWED